MSMPSPPNWLMPSPFTVLLPPVMSRPETLPPALAPLQDDQGVPLKSGWEVPSMMTGVVITGRADRGAMVKVFVVGSYPGSVIGMSKVMVLLPPSKLLSLRACRSEPGPLSLLLATARETDWAAPGRPR